MTAFATTSATRLSSAVAMIFSSLISSSGISLNDDEITIVNDNNTTLSMEFTESVATIVNTTQSNTTYIDYVTSTDYITTPAETTTEIQEDETTSIDEVNKILYRDNTIKEISDFKYGLKK